jgi:flotillin
MAAIAAQVPALFESLSGMSLAELFSKVKQIGDPAPKPSPELPSGNDPAGGRAKAAGKA